MNKDVFDAISNDNHEAANMRISAMILSELILEIKSWGLTQKEAALKLETTQLRLNDLLKGRMGSFSLGNLFDLSQKAGLNYDLIKRAA